MPVTTVNCPHCGRKGSTTKTIPDGAKIKCPGCQQSFSYRAPTELETIPLAEPELVVEAPPPVRYRPPVAQAVPVPVPQAHAHPAVVQNVTVNVPEARKGNAVAVASLVLGILGVLFCWVPLVGLLAVPVGGLAALLGVVGLTLALATKRPGVSSAAIGLVLGGTACVVPVVMTAAGVSAVNQALEQQRKRDAAAEASAPPAEPAIAAAPAPVPAPAGPARKPAVPPVSWVEAPNAARIGDVEVAIERVQVGQTTFKTFGTEAQSKDDLTNVTVRVANRSATAKAGYQTWAGNAIGSFTRDYATLTDEFKNTYSRVGGMSTEPVGRTESGSIYPGRVLTDVLVFEAPTDQATELLLELPGENVGVQGMFRFKIPAKMFRP